MDAGQSKYARRLRTLQGKAVVVRIWRFEKKSEYSAGFVLKVRGDLLLIAVLSDQITLDGYSIVRLRDISRVQSLARQSRLFYRRALPAGKVPPPCPRWVKMARMEAALRSVNLREPILTIHTERRQPGMCFIGHICGGTLERFQLDEIDADALWNRKSWFRTANVTRVDWGGGYERALWRAGGKPRRAKG